MHGIEAEVLVEASTFRSKLGDALNEPRHWTALVSSFAAAAGTLAALGVFGLMSYLVRQQRRDIGVRLALGATPLAMALMVVRKGVRYAIAGSCVGVGLAVVAGQMAVDVVIWNSARRRPRHCDDRQRAHGHRRPCLLVARLPGIAHPDAWKPCQWSELRWIAVGRTGDIACSTRCVALSYTIANRLISRTRFLLSDLLRSSSAARPHTRSRSVSRPSMMESQTRGPCALLPAANRIRKLA